MATYGPGLVTSAVVGTSFPNTNNNNNLSGFKTVVATKHHPVCLAATGVLGFHRRHLTSYTSASNSSSIRNIRIMASAAATSETEKLGIKIVKNPPESKLSDLGVRSWPKWGCPPSKFPWTYSSRETCYLLKGKVKVYPDGSDEGVEFGAGDMVVFPKGMSCTWDVSEAVDKHYQFDD